VILVTSVLRRKGTASLLRRTPYNVVAAVAGPTELTDHDLTKEGRALAIVGIDSENGSLNQAAESVRRLRSLIPNGKIVLLDEANRPFDLPSVLALAPDGYILNPSRDVLLKSLEQIFINDQQVFVLGRPITTLGNEQGDRGDFDSRPPAVGCRPESSYGSEKKTTQSVRLSDRQCQVLICLACGESNKRTARLCHISEATVKVYVKTILRKTHTQNRTQAAIWAMEHELQDSVLRATTEPPS
jgi:two-component system nitrate/nitrite response regulator NarL